VGHNPPIAVIAPMRKQSVRHFENLAVKDYLKRYRFPQVLCHALSTFVLIRGENAHGAPRARELVDTP
jgi:hypothetical protein